VPSSERSVIGVPACNRYFPPESLIAAPTDLFLENAKNFATVDFQTDWLTRVYIERHRALALVTGM
jgi:hypothetical protein